MLPLQMIPSATWLLAHHVLRGDSILATLPHVSPVPPTECQERKHPTQATRQATAA